MDYIRDVKNKINYEYWTKLIEDIQQSNKTIKTYCEENEINKKAYYYWLRKIRKLECERISNTYEIKAEKSEFAPITSTISLPLTNATIKVQIGKIIIEITEGMSEQTI